MAKIIDNINYGIIGGEIICLKYKNTYSSNSIILRCDEYNEEYNNNVVLIFGLLLNTYFISCKEK